MKKEEKILKVLKENKVFLVSETEKYEYYLCKGVNNNVYDIIYFKGLDKWKCDCNNIRKTACYHIEAAKRVKYSENAEDYNNDIVYIN